MGLLHKNKKNLYAHTHTGGNVAARSAAYMADASLQRRNITLD